MAGPSRTPVEWALLWVMLAVPAALALGMAATLAVGWDDLVPWQAYTAAAAGILALLVLADMVWWTL